MCPVSWARLKEPKTGISLFRFGYKLDAFCYRERALLLPLLELCNNSNTVSWVNLPTWFQ